jgi:hypothetical protein
LYDCCLIISSNEEKLKKSKDVAQADELKEKYAMEKLLESLLDKKLDPLNGKLEQVLNSIQFLSAQYDDLIKKSKRPRGKKRNFRSTKFEIEISCRYSTNSTTTTYRFD